MGIESQHGSPNSANNVVSPRTGSLGDFSLAGMELFASLDIDALLGSAATAGTNPSAGVPKNSPATLTSTGQRSCQASCLVPHAGTEEVPHQPYPQASHISTLMPHSYPAQMPQAFTAQALLAHPQVVPFYLSIAQTPAISIARGGQSCSAEAGQLSLGQAPGWTSISAPVGACEGKVFSAQVRAPDEMALYSLNGLKSVQKFPYQCTCGQYRSARQCTVLPCISDTLRSHLSTNSSAGIACWLDQH